MIGRLICIEACIGMRLHDEGGHIIVGGGGYWGPSQETSFFVTDPHEMWGPEKLSVSYVSGPSDWSWAVALGA
ncbi:hypothetical protein Pyn_36708 [Prunus yedoensis var. nudiflora]|uniref:Uncharacterized protein n=1 Tax=Prunus yedoensis var. nudiflora TaxID=2094558 RepID=A0A314Z6P5_PRUYE|nr:hypothetical protein Pyn_36708 [Prunus yedoensis var. nudiflora]